MTRIHLYILALAVLGTLGLAGCKSDAQKISSANYLLNYQHRSWAKVRDSFEPSHSPAWSEMARLSDLLNNRVPKRMDIDYEGARKAEVVDLLRKINERYQANVMTKMMPTDMAWAPRPGFSTQQIRDCFMAIDPDYRKLEDMTK